MWLNIGYVSGSYYFFEYEWSYNVCDVVSEGDFYWLFGCFWSFDGRLIFLIYVLYSDGCVFNFIFLIFIINVEFLMGKGCEVSFNMRKIRFECKSSL